MFNRAWSTTISTHASPSHVNSTSGNVEGRQERGDGMTNSGLSPGLGGRLYPKREAWCCMMERLLHDLKCNPRTDRKLRPLSNFLGNSNRLLMSQAFVCKNVSPALISKLRSAHWSTLSVSQTAILQGAHPYPR